MIGSRSNQMSRTSLNLICTLGLVAGCQPGGHSEGSTDSTATPDLPPEGILPAADHYFAEAGLPRSVSAEYGLLANDDLNGEQLEVLRAPDTSDLLSAQLGVNGDGSFIYTVDENECGEDRFEYEVEDREGLTRTAEVVIWVWPTDDSAPFSTCGSRVPSDSEHAWPAGDMNGDGREDLVLRNPDGVIFGRAELTNVEDVDTVITGWGPLGASAVASSDVDADGLSDAVLVGLRHMTILWGSTDLPSEVDVVNPTTEAGLRIDFQGHGDDTPIVRASNDLDGDGLEDLVLAFRYCDSEGDAYDPGCYQPGSLYLLPGADGRIPITQADLVDLGAWDSLVDIDVGDFNGDGQSDVLVHESRCFGDICYSDDGYTTALLDPVDPDGPVLTIPAHEGARSAGDVNGDGRDDILIETSTDGSSVLLWGRDEGAVDLEQALASGEAIRIIGTQVSPTPDLNGDDRAELVDSADVVNVAFGAPWTSEVAIDAELDFRRGLPTNATDGFGRLDFDGDGVLDVLTSGWGGTIILRGVDMSEN